MHIASTITSTKSTHDIPVLVLASSDAEGTIHSRKFVARPCHYQELVVTARRIFNIKDDTTLVFGTSTLDVCRGAWIEIEESAYELLLECLGEVIVRSGAPHEDVGRATAVKDEARDADRVVDSSPIQRDVSTIESKGRSDSQADMSASLLDGSSTLAPLVPAKNEPRTRSGSTAINRPVSLKFDFTPGPMPDMAPRPAKSRVLTQLDELSGQKLQPLSDSRQHKPEPESERKHEVEEKVKFKSRPASASRQNKIEPEPEPPRARQRDLKRKMNPELAEEDEESGKENEKDHEFSSDAKTEKPSDTVRKKKGFEDEEDDFWRFGANNSGPNTTSIRAQSVLPPTHPLLNSKLTRKGTMIDVEEKKEPEEKKGKIKDARARLSTVNATQLPSASVRPLGNFQQDPDMRFMVTVYGPRIGQGADFRTRGGHKIKKVLESACKTFGLPFERSRLVLEDDSRELKQYYCDPEDTIGSCGIDTDSQLLVQVDGMTEHDLSKYEEEEEDED